MAALGSRCRGLLPPAETDPVSLNAVVPAVLPPLWVGRRPSWDGTLSGRDVDEAEVDREAVLSTCNGQAPGAGATSGDDALRMYSRARRWDASRCKISWATP